MEYKFIDLFCGLGGFRLAFEKNNGRCVFSSDIDKSVSETYKRNFGELPSGDITEIETKDIPDFDILCAGFPCQSFSIAGKRLGFEDVRGTMFFEVARIIKEKKPKAFLLENVKGLTNHEKGKTLEKIKEILTELNYTFDYKVINASDHGIPQSRERWYCVGFRNDLKINPKKEILFPEKKEMLYTVDDIIQEKLDNDSYVVSDICSNNIKIHTHKIKSKDSKYSLAYEIRPSRCQFRTNGISPCLTAKMGTGGNNVPVVIELNRKLTEKECLKIMGYPNDYIIGTGSQAYKQIGNSVVVPVITEIAKNIVTLLDKGCNE